MEDEMVYCKNCKREVAAGNYVLHSAHCERNIQLCSYCSEPVPRREMEEHLENSHSMDACSNCSMPMEKWMLEKHKDSCPKQPVRCEFCDLEISADCLEEHIAACGARTEKCSICHRYVMLQDMKSHQNICKKDVPSPELSLCRYCQNEIPSNILDSHISNCKLKIKRCPDCGEMVKRYIDNHICQKARFSVNTEKCQYCDLVVSSALFQEHIDYCARVPVQCKICNETFLRRNEKQHSCKQGPSKSKGICTYCKKEIPYIDLNVHTHACALSLEKKLSTDSTSKDNVKKQAVLLSSPISKRFVDLTPKNKTFEAPSSHKPFQECKLCGEKMPSLIYTAHFEICPKRPHECKFCLKNVLFSKRRPEDHDCLMTNDCDSLDRKHETYKSIVKEESFESEKSYIANAASNKYQSTIPSQECKLCGDRISSSIYTHFETCSKRPHVCKLCLKTVPFCKRRHEDHDCQMIRSFDSLDKKHETYRSIDMEKSSESQYKCELCLETMPLSQKYGHINKECKIIYGAENDSPRINLKESFGPEKYSAIAASNKYPSEDYLKKISELCTICGNKFPVERFKNHLQYCRARRKMCHFCKENYFIEDEDLHLRQCLEKKESETAEKDRAVWNQQSASGNGGNSKQKAFGPEKSYAAITASNEYPSEDYLLKHSELCTICGNKIPVERFKNHMQYCSARKKMCHFCKESIFIEEEDQHLRQCLEKKERETAEADKAVGNQQSASGNGGVISKRKGKKNKKNQGSGGILDRMFPNRQNSNKNSVATNVVPENEFEHDGIPCEFCNEIFPFIQIIEHQSGCRPDLARYTVPEASGYTSPNARGAKQLYAEHDSLRITSTIGLKGSSDVQDKRNEHHSDTIQDNFRRKTYPSNWPPSITADEAKWDLIPKRDKTDDKKVHEKSHSDAIQDKSCSKSYPSNWLPTVTANEAKCDLASKRDPADDRKVHEQKQISHKVLFQYSSRSDQDSSDLVVEGKNIDLQESVKSKIMPGEFLLANYTPYQARSSPAFKETYETKGFENGTNLELLYSERNSKVKDVNSTSDHELKAIGAERGQRKGIFQIDKNTELYSCGTTHDKQNNTEHYSQNVCSEVVERTRSFNSDNTTGSSEDIYLSCGEELDEVKPFINDCKATPVDEKHENESSEHVIMPSEEDDSKSEETFGDNRQEPLNNQFIEIKRNIFEDVCKSEQDEDLKNKETFGSDCEADLDHNEFKSDRNHLCNTENNASKLTEWTFNSTDYMEDILKLEDFVLRDENEGKKDSDLGAYFQFLEKDDKVSDSSNGCSKNITSDKKPCNCHNSVCYCAFNQQSTSSEDNTLAMVELNELIAKGAGSKKTYNCASLDSAEVEIDQISDSELFASSNQPMAFDWKLESELRASSNKPMEMSVEVQENVSIFSKEEKENSANWTKWRSQCQIDTDSD